MNKIINQRERLTPESPTSKYGKCPNHGDEIVELEIDYAGYIICSICKNRYGIEIYHSLN